MIFIKIKLIFFLTKCLFCSCFILSSKFFLFFLALKVMTLAVKSTTMQFLTNLLKLDSQLINFTFLFHLNGYVILVFFHVLFGLSYYFLILETFKYFLLNFEVIKIGGTRGKKVFHLIRI